MEQYVTNAQGYVELFYTLLQKLDTDKMNRIVMLLWSIWWRRNKKCLNDLLPLAFEVNRRAINALDEWARVQRKPCHINQNTHWYNIGACIRDDRGRFVKAMTADFVGQPAVYEAEAQGLLVSLKWLQQMQITTMII
ncbi:replication protein A 70 kDa DNA-binding subunit [Trifolium pratense]|uniref:Replication protein A 70 kDa DNA-binding subunit n=1 Tax=Trifolium pratense TaxID=57577 RepID=A0A2K3LJA2_TRIPR|nr:replication protein A 70 kDa DNA-binding subunit [Trifolium pratense]